MYEYAHKQKLTVPNSLALAAAAVLVWSADGSSAPVDETFAQCGTNATVVSVQQEDRTLPSMSATPESCGYETGPLQRAQPGDAIVKSMQSASLRLLYLPAKSLIHH